ncbi:MAG: metallophosphoesterase [Hydrogenibacillus sp.]|nr:metallophosphoesterase [Hydrogenibacillus sp.]
MRLLVMSDTHGLVDSVAEVVRRHPADYVIHCGDVVAPVDRPPFREMIIVSGNMDRDPALKTHRLLRWEGVLIAVTHGHLYDVKRDLLQLSLFAREHGARMVFYGHSHVPGWTVEGGVLYLNPGSLARPRGYSQPTVAVVDLVREGSQLNVEIIYYDADGRAEPPLGGRTALTLG